nr:hypothetical protein [Nocardia brevicatena]
MRKRLIEYSMGVPNRSDPRYSARSGPVDTGRSRSAAVAAVVLDDSMDSRVVEVETPRSRRSVA